jgi:hypothetical protein
MKCMVPNSGIAPFDRHDWYVDRCGREIKYVIDYYSIEDPQSGEVTYSIGTSYYYYATAFASSTNTII